MMTSDQIESSIAALLPAPAHESLHRVAVRAAEWLLSTIADEHPAIAQTRALYTRVIDDGGLCAPPTEAEWQANIAALALARDLARDLALARGLALDLDRGLDRAIDFGLATAVVRLLGDRLQPLLRLDRAVLSAVEAPGCSLYMGSYHHCETTHCRAGWAITLHPLGRDLEAAFGPWLAGAVIYQVSTGRVPNFFASDEAALADIRACAADGA